MMMNKSCLECGEKVIGRADKKFCCDQCRNAYNNHLNKPSKNLIRNINNRLKRNYRILEEFRPEAKTKISKSRLINRGFDFDYLTNIYHTKKGTVYYFVYDLGYLPLENDMFMIVKRER